MAVNNSISFEGSKVLNNFLSCCKLEKPKAHHALIAVITLCALVIIALLFAIPLAPICASFGIPLILGALVVLVASAIRLKVTLSKKEVFEGHQRLGELIQSAYPGAFLIPVVDKDGTVDYVSLLSKYPLTLSELYRLAYLAAGDSADVFADSQKVLDAYAELLPESKALIGRLRQEGLLDLDSIVQEHCPSYWLAKFSSAVLRKYDTRELGELVHGKGTFPGIFHPSFLPVFSLISMENYQKLAVLSQKFLNYTVWSEDPRVQAIIHESLLTHPLNQEDKKQFLHWMYLGLGICVLNAEAKMMLENLTRNHGQHLEKLFNSKLWQQIEEVSTDDTAEDFDPQQAYKTWRDW
ncbi:hypothetical protein [Chlamydia vaughanii]|uniref:hypothetical protein n=1 Tax=Chlamydia vaughanii TaxID=3112552 RepID=UPI0032B2FB8B